MKNPIGDFSTRDGTIDFFLRVRSILPEQSTVLDLGAGRGSWANVHSIGSKLHDLRNGGAYVIGVDIDPVVLENNAVDQSLVMKGETIPLDNESVDVIVASWVMEHVENPTTFSLEVNRVLKPGGWFCGVTPHKLNYRSLAATALPFNLHIATLRYLQPKRAPEDAFPTFYRMNTIAEIEKFFPSYSNRSFIYPSEPAYTFGSDMVYRLMLLAHSFMPAQLYGSIFAVLQKPQVF
jgi:SAM-dependent methyltransferase